MTSHGFFKHEDEYQVNKQVTNKVLLETDAEVTGQTSTQVNTPIGKKNPKATCLPLRHSYLDLILTHFVNSYIMI